MTMMRINTIDPQVIDNLTDITFRPNDHFPATFDEKKFNHINSIYKGFFIKILQTKEEFEDDILRIPSENQNEFKDRFVKRVKKLSGAALTKHRAIIKHYLEVWVMKSDISGERKVEFWSLLKTNPSMKILLEKIKSEMDDSTQSNFDEAIFSCEELVPKMIDSAFKPAKIIQAPDNSSGGEMPQPAIALLHYYLSFTGDGPFINEQNKDSIANKYGWVNKYSGTAIKNHFSKYQQKTHLNLSEHKVSDNKLIAYFEIVTKMLVSMPGTQKSLSMAQNEYKIYLGKYNRHYK